MDMLERTENPSVTRRRVLKLASAIFSGAALPSWFAPARGDQGADADFERFWSETPLMVSHTHIDPDDIKGSVEELIDQGVTTAGLCLSMDDGDWRSKWSDTKPERIRVCECRESHQDPTCQSIPHVWDPYVYFEQYQGGWLERVSSRIAAIKSLSNVDVIRNLNDIPSSPSAVRRMRRRRRIAVFFDTEGTNHLHEGSTNAAIADEAEAKCIYDQVNKNISMFRQDGWLMTSMTHAPSKCREGDHPFVKRGADGFSLNEQGEQVLKLLLERRIIIDLPHLDGLKFANIMDVVRASPSDVPLMISHDTTTKHVDDSSWTNLATEVCKSGGGTGFVGVHSHMDYYPPGTIPSVSAYADAIVGLATFLSQSGVVGSMHVGFGLDWFFKQQNGFKSEFCARKPGELKAVVKNLREGFISGGRTISGLNDEQLKDIMGRNILRVLSKVLT